MRRKDIWEQAAGQPFGDSCRMCADHDCGQLKVRTEDGWQACPHCDKPYGEHAQRARLGGLK